MELNVSIARSVPRVRALSRSAAHVSLLTSVWSVCVVKQAKVTPTSAIFHLASRVQSVTQTSKQSVFVQLQKTLFVENANLGKIVTVVTRPSCSKGG